jgi:hypothetical protein
LLVIKSDNRVLTASSKFSTTLENNPSGVSTLSVSNLNPFTVGDPILIGEFGQFDAEILKVKAIDTSTMKITLGDLFNNATVTTFSHTESTKVYVLPFDQIRFYHTPATGTILDETPVFNEDTPLTSWTTIDPTSFYTVYNDTFYDTGFGWFLYKNALTDDVSQESNPVPYTGFTGNTAEFIFADFQSLLNSNELKLVTYADMFSWLNEAIAIFTNKLNLSNPEFTVTSPQTVTLIAGVAEYLLPPDFTDMVEIVHPTTSSLAGTVIDFIPVSHVQEYNASSPSRGGLKYYLRGRYLGFSPVPTHSGGIVKYTYRARSSRISSLSTIITLPDNGEMILKSWMMYRAYMKFNNPLASMYLQDWTNSLNLLIQSSVKRNSSLECFGISSSSNV